MERIKIAQIGVSHEHAAGKIITLRQMSDVYEIVGVVDDSATAAPKFPNGMEHFEGLRRMTEEEVFRYPGLQGVVVEVPNTELVPTAIRCMEHNLPMHLDKPAGEDLTLFGKLLDGCRAKNLPLQMGYMFRGNPAFQFCIAAVREKLIGEVFEIEADMNHNYGGDEYQEYIGKFRGGIMYNLGCHLIDFVVAAMGRPEQVTPFLKSAPGCPETTRNSCMAVLEYPHASVTLRSSSRAPGCQRRMRIAGSRGVIEFSPLERFDGRPVELSLSLGENSGSFPAGEHTLRFPPQTDRYVEQFKELARVIRGEGKSTYSYDHDYLVHEITLAAAGYTQWR